MIPVHTYKDLWDMLTPDTLFYHREDFDPEKNHKKIKTDLNQ